MMLPSAMDHINASTTSTLSSIGWLPSTTHTAIPQSSVEYLNESSMSGGIIVTDTTAAPGTAGEDDFSSPESVVSTVSLIVVSTLCNMFLLTVLLFRRPLRAHPSNRLLVSLTALNLMVSLVVMPLFIFIRLHPQHDSTQSLYPWNLRPQQTHDTDTSSATLNTQGTQSTPNLVNNITVTPAPYTETSIKFVELETVDGETTFIAVEDETYTTYSGLKTQLEETSSYRKKRSVNRKKSIKARMARAKREITLTENQDQTGTKKWINHSMPVTDLPQGSADGGSGDGGEVVVELPGLICEVTAAITNWLLSTSAYTVTVIALDRYLSLSHPLAPRSGVVARSRCTFLLGGCWAIGGVIAFPPAVGWGRYGYRSDWGSCGIMWNHSISYSCLWLIFVVLLPLTIITVCYTMILQMARAKCRSKVSVGTMRTDAEQSSAAVTPLNSSRNSSTKSDNKEVDSMPPANPAPPINCNVPLPEQYKPISSPNLNERPPSTYCEADRSFRRTHSHHSQLLSPNYRGSASIPSISENDDGVEETITRASSLTFSFSTPKDSSASLYTCEEGTNNAADSPKNVNRENRLSESSTDATYLHTSNLKSASQSSSENFLHPHSGPVRSCTTPSFLQLDETQNKNVKTNNDTLSRSSECLPSPRSSSFYRTSQHVLPKASSDFTLVTSRKPSTFNTSVRRSRSDVEAYAVHKKRSARCSRTHSLLSWTPSFKSKLSFRSQRNSWGWENSPKKGLRTVSVLVGLQILTWVPYSVVVLLELMTTPALPELPQPPSPTVKWWLTLLLLSACALQPVVYGLLNRAIRKQTRALMVRYCDSHLSYLSIGSCLVKKIKGNNRINKRVRNVTLTPPKYNALKLHLFKTNTCRTAGLKETVLQTTADTAASSGNKTCMTQARHEDDTFSQKDVRSSEKARLSLLNSSEGPKNICSNPIQLHSCLKNALPNSAKNISSNVKTYKEAAKRIARLSICNNTLNVKKSSNIPQLLTTPATPSPPSDFSKLDIKSQTEPFFFQDNTQKDIKESSFQSIPNKDEAFVFDTNVNNYSDGSIDQQITPTPDIDESVLNESCKRPSYNAPPPSDQCDTIDRKKSTIHSSVDSFLSVSGMDGDGLLLTQPHSAGGGGGHTLRQVVKNNNNNILVTPVMRRHARVQYSPLYTMYQPLPLKEGAYSTALTEEDEDRTTLCEVKPTHVRCPRSILKKGVSVDKGAVDISELDRCLMQGYKRTRRRSSSLPPDATCR